VSIGLRPSAARAVALTHWGGNANVRAVLTGLHDGQLLSDFFTSIRIDPKKRWVRALPRQLRTELSRRSFEIPAERVDASPGRELLRLAGARMPAPLGRFMPDVDLVQRHLDGRVARHLESSRGEHIRVVYSYEDGAQATFETARARGLSAAYDLPIAYWETARDLMLEERDRLPEWAPALGGGLADPPEKLARKTRELEFADLVITPSEFVASSLPAWVPRDRIVVAPFGTPRHSKSPRPIADPSRPLRVLFVGSMSQRKGLADLLASLSLLSDEQIELVVLGSPQVHLDFYRQFGEFTYEPTRPRDGVLQLMATCDVFCLPSIYEGRALVIQEAMAQGLPIIVTTNTGGEDLVVEGETGFLVPIRSPEVIADRIARFAQDRERAAEMGLSAATHAASYTWANYQSTVVSAVLDLLGHP
jgi:glycosyltransferase involved in cell wall biosynthesis